MAGPATLAESLGWSEKAFHKAFREVLSQGLAKASFEDQIIWLPNAIKYNAPESPNVVKSWSDTWDEIAECEMKVEIYQILKAFLEGYGKGFAESFGKACRKPSLKAMPNQEQEQDIKETKAKKIASPRELFDIFWEAYPRKEGKDRCERWFNDHKPSHEILDQMLATISAYKQSEQWQDTKFIPHPSTWLNRGGWKDELPESKEEESPADDFYENLTEEEREQRRLFHEEQKQ